MHIVTKKEGKTLKAAFVGELDHHSAQDVRQKLDDILESSIELLELDMSGVGFMDSSGIGVLIGRYNLMHSWGGKICIVKSNEQVDKLMKMAGLYSIIENKKPERARR